MEEKSPYCITYTFEFENGNQKRFDIMLDPVTITLITKESVIQPEWARLDFHQCACCTLNKEAVPYCPIAVNIAELIDEFKNEISSLFCLF